METTTNTPAEFKYLTKASILEYFESKEEALRSYEVLKGALIYDQVRAERAIRENIVFCPEFSQTKTNNADLCALMAKFKEDYLNILNTQIEKRQRQINHIKTL